MKVAYFETFIDDDFNNELVEKEILPSDIISILKVDDKTIRIYYKTNETYYRR